MTYIEEKINNYLTNENEYSIEDIAELFANNSDIEIAMDIYDNVDCEKYNIDDVEQLVFYMRKTRKYTVAE
jgi:hypothetical protein